ncbi:hypothetical protein, partial [Gluconobacter cerinus]|uniref:hypothetical protein n=1 Tax=Gluconobacter cerinus TaxID=38307 RepID=UPI001B8D7752
ETLNQSAKKLKSSDKRINKQFFDPSRCSLITCILCGIHFRAVVQGAVSFIWYDINHVAVSFA